MERFEITGRQLKAARALAGLTQQQLADAAYLHVNSVRYMERKEWIRRCGHSTNMMIEVLREFGVELTFVPARGVQLVAGNSDCLSPTSA